MRGMMILLLSLILCFETLILGIPYKHRPYDNYINRKNPRLSKTTPRCSSRIEDYEYENGRYHSFSPFGHWSRVFIAREKATRRRVVIKSFPKKPRYFDERIDKLVQNDAIVLFNLDEHPNIIRLYAVSNQQLEPYLCPDLIFEYMSGGDAFNYYQTHLSWSSVFEYHHQRTIKSIMRQVFTGITFLHANGVLHRDIKVDNIFLKGKVAKIGDFGFATFLNKTTGFEQDTLSYEIGAIEYKPPERLQFEKYSYPSDIWSTGITFLKLIVGDTKLDAFRGKRAMFLSIEEHIGVIGEDRFPKSSLFKRASDKIRDHHAMDLIAQCLKIDPNERITAAQALNHPYFK